MRPAGDRRVRVLLLGSTEAPEFSNVLSLIAEWDEVSFVAYATCVELTNREDDCDLLVVLQRFPEEYAQQQVIDLLNRFASSRMVVCYGPWCDSDGRTRSLWPTSCRVRVESAGTRIRHELSVIRDLSKPLPLTANRDEAYLFDHADSHDQGALSHVRALRIALNVADPAILAWLRTTIAQAGHEIVSTSDINANVRLCDVDPWNCTMAASIAELRTAQPRVPLVALSGYVRPREAEEIREAGVNAVVAKLAPLSAILRAIADVVSGQIPVGGPQRLTGGADVRGLRIVSDDT